jgi:tryptophan synthase alpha chain
LVSPQTSEERLSKIEELSTSFIYAVSTNSTTGGITDFSSQEEYFQRLKDHLSKPFLIGFGVKDKNTFETACNYANGAIVGSAFINSLMEKGRTSQKIENFINQLRN